MQALKLYSLERSLLTGYIYLIIIKFSEQSMHLLEVFPKQLVFGLITSLNLRSDYLRIAVYLQSPNLHIAS